MILVCFEQAGKVMLLADGKIRDIWYKIKSKNAIGLQLSKALTIGWAVIVGELIRRQKCHLHMALTQMQTEVSQNWAGKCESSDDIRRETL
ncbi:MAG: hypothetical protein AAFV95_10310 [Bacteroidota bacterium]